MLKIWFFRYNLEDGTSFRGRTFLLQAENTIYILIGANDTLYWVEFTESEYENEDTFTKTVRLGKFSFDVWTDVLRMWFDAYFT